MIHGQCTATLDHDLARESIRTAWLLLERGASELWRSSVSNFHSAPVVRAFSTSPTLTALLTERWLFYRQIFLHLSTIPLFMSVVSCVIVYQVFV